MHTRILLTSLIALAACGGSKNTNGGHDASVQDMRVGSSNEDGGGNSPDGSTSSGGGQLHGPCGDNDACEQGECIDGVCEEPGSVQATVPGNLGNPMTSGGYTSVCRDTRTEPSRSGANGTFTFRLQDFTSRDPVPDLRLFFFSSNQISSSMSDSQNGTTDENGELSVEGNVGAWYAYYVNGNGPSGRLTTVQYNEPAPANNGTTRGGSITMAARDAIYTAASRTPANGTATLIGSVRDCDNGIMANAVVRMFRENGTRIEHQSSSGGSAYLYTSSGTTPDTSRTFTGTAGGYLGLNVPTAVGSELVRVEAWVREGGVSKLHGCEKVRVFPDSVVLLNIGPRRADGPSDCTAD